MALSDQDMRTTAMKNPDQWDDSVDQRNTARLKKIVEEIGWPTIPKVGAEASLFWRIVYLQW